MQPIPLTPPNSQIPQPHHNYYTQDQQQNQQQEEQVFPLIKQMIFHLKQQQLAPVLLQFKSVLFTRLKTELKDQEERLQIYKKDIDPDTKNSQRNYKTIIYSMEIQKISFILKHYLKIRLEKIQKCSFYYFKNMAIAEQLMSKSQVDFMKKYVDLRYKYYEKNVFKHLAKNFRGLGGMELFLNKPQETKLVNSNQSFSNVLEPDMKSYVFVKMNRNPNEFRYKTDMPILDVPGQESQIASSNDILFIPYGVAKSLMQRSQEGDLFLM